MAFCANCGISLDDGTKFCPKCGNPASTLYPKYRDKIIHNSPNAVYRYIGLVALFLLVLLGIAGLSENDNNDESSFFSIGKTEKDIKSIKSVEQMKDAIKNTIWTHTEKGDIWYKFVFKEETMIHYAAFPSDGHWRYLGEVEYSIVENRSSYDGKRYIAAVFDIAKYSIPVEFNFSDCHLYSFGFDIGRCKLGDFEWD